MIIELVPEVTMVGTGSMVSDVDVIRIGDPERSWHLIGIEHTKGSVSTDSEVSENLILGLNTVFHEVGMTSDMISDILDDSQVVDTMHGDSSVVGVMDGVTLDV